MLKLALSYAALIFLGMASLPGAGIAFGEDGWAMLLEGPAAVEGPAGRLSCGELRPPVGSASYDLKFEVLTAPGARCGLCFPAGAMAFEVRINNSFGPPRDCSDLIKTGSLVSRRNLCKSIAKDGQWFTIQITAGGGRIQVRVNDQCVVDTDASTGVAGKLGTVPIFTQRKWDCPPRTPDGKQSFLLAAEAYEANTKVLFKNVRVKFSKEPLPAAAAPAKPDAVDAEIAQLQREGFPLVDFHVHLKGGLTLEQAVEKSRKSGINFGIAANCGVKFPITDDQGIDQYVKKLAGQPVFIGMQAEGREWPKLFSKEAIARFDYVFSDGMTIVDHRGHRARLWIKDEVDIPDEQAFMELLVRTIVGILSHEPIDIYVNPTYLPVVLAKDYDRLWTPERLRKIIDAAAANGVAIEISNSLHLPKPAFIKDAKRAGIKFTLGTNNTNGNLGRCEYGLQMIRQCGLTREDMWMPKPNGQKPIQVRKYLSK